MKKLATLFLVAVVLLQCSMKMAIVAYYQLNKDYIASTLCVNKAKPKMQCNGKCYLTKKIKAQESQEQAIPSLFKGVEDVTLFFSSTHFAFSRAFYLIKSVHNTLYVVRHYTTPFGSILQPPQ